MKDFEHLIYKICLFSFFRLWRQWQILSVANITSVCKNKDNNVDFVSAQWEFNVLYHYTLDNLSVDQKDKIAITVETGVFYRHIFMVSCLKLFNKQINTHGDSPDSPSFFLFEFRRYNLNFGVRDLYDKTRNQTP